MLFLFTIKNPTIVHPPLWIKSAEALCLRACRPTSNPQIPIQSSRGGIYASPLPPPRLRPGQVLAAVPGDLGLKGDPKPISFFDRFSMPFWLHFGSDLGAFWGPFWRQNRPKFRPRCPFKPYLLQKRDFHETIVKPTKYDDF